MTKHLTTKKALSVFISIALIFSMLFAAVPQAYAATLAKPVVTLTSTAPTTIKVSWKKVSGAEKYTVYRSLKKSGGFKAVKTTTSTSFSNKKLTCGKTYYFKVKAIKGKNSVTSKVVKKAAVPQRVASPKASAKCSSITISWSKASGVDGYQVYASSSKNGAYKKIGSAKKNSFTETSLKLAKSRYYKARAYKKAGKKTYYGEFSSIVSAKTAHAPSTSWTITKKATCAETGIKTNVCKHCKKKYTAVIEKDDTSHEYNFELVPADDTYASYKKYTCSRCGDVYTTKKKAHKFKAEITEPTCSAQGYTTFTCKDCGYSYSGEYTDTIPHIMEEISVPVTCTTDGYTASKCSVCSYLDEESKHDIIVASGKDHNYVSEKDENDYIIYNCTVCGYTKTDTTCYINLTEKTISIPSVAEFGFSSSNTTGIYDKLDLNSDGVSGYEITGSAENLTIDVNAYFDTDVKLNGCSITNTSKDCIDVKDKSPDESLDSTEENPINDKIPTVSISAADGSENFLTANVSSNAIDSSTNIDFKGHGTLTIVTDKTSVSCTGKIEIKNLTLSITSKTNRAIDTKKETLNSVGAIVSTEYSNITIKPNATITINSADDGIRCKNMTFEEAGEDDTPTIMTITAGADGIQLEGKKGIVMYSGILNVKGAKKDLNNKSGIETIVSPAQINKG